MKEYFTQQDRLNEQVKDLLELTERLNNLALKHNPEGILNYMDILVKDARARGLKGLEPLIKAKKFIKKSVSVKERGHKGDIFIVEILNKIKGELERRIKLNQYARLSEEAQHCDFYNRLWKILPEDIQCQAPSELKGTGMKNVPFSDNLRAIVQLLKVLLSKGIFEGREFSF